MNNSEIRSETIDGIKDAHLLATAVFNNLTIELKNDINLSIKNANTNANNNNLSNGVKNGNSVDESKSKRLGF